MVSIEEHNGTHLKVHFDNEMDFSDAYDFFSVWVPGAEHDPKYKYGMWNGKKNFLYRDGRMLRGLKGRLIRYLESKGLEYEDNVEIKGFDVTPQDIVDFVETLNIPFKPRDYQLRGAYLAIKNGMQTLLASTGAGKSLSIFLLVEWAIKHNMKMFIIVPSAGLVEQLYSDFVEDYKMDEERAEKYIKKIYGGQDKFSNHLIKVSTFHSLATEGKDDSIDPEYFKDVEWVVCDETHRATADSIQHIITSSINRKMSCGLTGTLKTSFTEQLTVEGLLGEATTLITYREMVERGLATETIVHPIILSYPKDIRKAVKSMKYPEEQKFIRLHEPRINFISRFVPLLAKKGNTIVLFNNVDLGKELYERIKSVHPNTHIITGSTKPEERERIRIQMNEEEDMVVLATQSIMSTGVNIKNLHNLVFAQTFKESTLILQSLGRMVRKHHTKDQAHVYEIGDDCTWVTRGGNEKPNYLMKHFFERIETYEKHEFYIDEPKHVTLGG